MPRAFDADPPEGAWLSQLRHLVPLLAAGQFTLAPALRTELLDLAQEIVRALEAGVPVEEFEVSEESIGKLRLSRDLRAAAREISPRQQRILVDTYYQIQDNRKATANQLRAAHEEPNAWLTFFTLWMVRMEKIAAGGLDIASNQQAVSLWAKSIFGIGPVIAAGLAAYIDITKTPSVSGLWSLCGQNPTAVWEKGTKRPWNAALKVLCWKMGDSFCKFHNHEDCFYGHIYAARKVLEVERNLAGRFREQAEKTLANRRIKDKATRAIYEAGQLPAGRLELRARRVAVKLFLSHYFEVAYYEHYHTLPRSPYIQAKEPGLHRHYVPPAGYEAVFTVPPHQR